MPTPSEILSARLSSRNGSGADEGDLMKLTSVVQSVGEYGLGTIAAAGNYLDVLGGATRNLIAGEDPTAPFRNPLSDKGRVSGRQLLTRWGVTARNKPTGISGWVTDPVEGLSDLAGFGLEILLDPLGPLGTPFRIPRLFGRAHRAAGRLAVAPIRNMPYLGRAFDTGVEFSRRMARRMFDYRVGGTLHPQAQREAEEFTSRFFRSQDQITTQATGVAAEAERLGFSLRSDADGYQERVAAIARFFEGTEDFAEQIAPGTLRVPDELKPSLGSLRSTMNNLRTRSSRLLRTPDLWDQAGIEYFPRFLADTVKAAIDIEQGTSGARIASRVFKTVDAAADYRDQMLKGFYEGREGVNRLVRDPQWRSVIEEARTVVTDAGLVPGSFRARGIGLVGPRHLTSIANAFGETADNIWVTMGFNLDRPYAPVAEVESRLDLLRQSVERLAAQGQAPVQQMIAFGKHQYVNLGNGNGAALKWQNGRVLNLGGVQPAEHLGDVEWDRLVHQMRGNADALQRIQEARTAGIQGYYSWPDRQGRANYYIPRTSALALLQWDRRAAAFKRGVARQPLGEEELATAMIRRRIEQNYSDQVIREMPHVTSDGELLWRNLQTDEYRRVRRSEAATVGPQLEARGFEQVHEDRYTALADLVVRREKIRELGVYGNNPIVDWADGMNALSRRTETAETLFRVVRDTFMEQVGGNGGAFSARRVALGIGESTPGMEVGDLLRAESTIDSVKFLNQLADSLQGQPVWSSRFKPSAAEVKAGRRYSREFADTVKRQIRLDNKVVGELRDMLTYFEGAPEVAWWRKSLDAYGSLHKASLLSTPATVLRDFFSATVMGVTRGDLKPYGRGATRIMDGMSLARGRAASEIDFPEVRQMAQELGLNPNSNDDRARAFVYMFTGHSNKSTLHAQALEADLGSLTRSGQVDDLLDTLPNPRNEGAMESIRRVWGQQSFMQNLNPFNVPGMLKRENGKWVKNSSSNIVVGLHSAVRGTLDNGVRMAGVLTNMDNGLTFREAFRKVAWGQVNYDRRTFTRFEKSTFKLLFPFYSFISRSLPLVAMELAQHPGGGLGKMIRAQRLAQGTQEDYVPYDLQDTAAIPMGENAQGDLVYIRNLGLMHEDALNYLAPTQGVRGILQRIVGSSHPLVKGIIEYATNTSTFFDGPMGGRRLDDLDPAVGRILNNLGVTDLQPSGRPAPFIGPLTEAIIANSPASAALRYAKTITEPIDRSPLMEKVLSLLSGVRIKHVSREQLIRELRDRLNAEQVAMGARPLTIVTGTEGLEASYREAGDAERADRLRKITDHLLTLRKEIKKQRASQ